MNNYYLVDYENVRMSGLNGLSRLNENDAVLIFYTENADTMTFGLYQTMNESKADIQFQKVKTGSPNALDFQLCSYLGYMIHEYGGENAAYYIVSKDLGYAVLSNYWKERDIHIYQIADIAGNPVSVKPAPSNVTKENALDKELEKELEKFLPDKRYISDIAKIIRENRTKTEINSALMRFFRPGPNNMDMAGIYQKIKPLLTDKK